MGITIREMMQPPKFEGLGKYVYCRPSNGDWAATFTFEFHGGQINVEVEDSEVLEPPAVGSYFHVSGVVRMNMRNGTISLVANEKKFVCKDDLSLSDDQLRHYVEGLRIRGVGVVKDKQAVQIGRAPAYLSTIIGWQGATYEFRKLTPELYQRIPAPAKGLDRDPAYVRFELTMLVRQERNNDGQKIVQQIPSLVWIQSEKVESGSMPSSAASTAVGSGMSKPAPAAPAPAKS